MNKKTGSIRSASGGAEGRDSGTLLRIEIDLYLKLSEGVLRTNLPCGNQGNTKL
jgi:hypothetical protein